MTTHPDTLPRTTDSAEPSVVVTQRHLDRVTQRDALVRAWAYLDPELALAQARAMDAAPRRSALHGVPIGLKDIIETADQPTAYGSPAWAGHRPDRDAEVVRRLRAAGAVIFGKTTSTEFATYRPSETRNPHHLGHTPGGSSSGSAAAVADGQVPVALGTQTGGSVLRPGAFCGVFTLKPTYGRWPFDGVLPVSLTFDTVGGLARHPDWLAALDGVIAAGEPDTPMPPLRELRVGLLRPPWADRATPAAAAALEDTAQALRAMVAEVVDIEAPGELAALDTAHTLIMAVEASSALAARVAAAPRDPDDELARFLADGREASADAIQQARLALRHARSFLDSAHRRVDVLLTLAAPGEAPQGFATTGDPVFNKLASTAGAPAIGLPVGAGVDGLPLGVQLIGPAHSDQALVRIAAVLTERGLAARCPLPEER